MVLEYVADDTTTMAQVKSLLSLLRHGYWNAPGRSQDNALARCTVVHYAVPLLDLAQVTGLAPSRILSLARNANEGTKKNACFEVRRHQDRHWIRAARAITMSDRGAMAPKRQDAERAEQEQAWQPGSSGGPGACVPRSTRSSWPPRSHCTPGRGCGGAPCP